MKRTLDILGSVVGLVVLAPILGLIGLAIRADSPGPILFLQERVGIGGRPFRIIKFRTMRRDAERAGPAVTVRNDTRVTRLGRILRKHKLDELPQLFNVLRGDMSFVGPRPEVPKYVAYYPDAMRARILSVRPGITDNAAVAFRAESEMLDGAVDPDRVYVEQILPIKLAYYEEYVANRSTAEDIRIVLRTLRALLSETRGREGVAG